MNSAISSRLKSRGLWRLCGGLIVWASCFAMLYGAQAAGCSAGLESRQWLGVNGVTAILAAIWAVHLVWLGGRLMRERRGRAQMPEGELDTAPQDAAFFAKVGQVLTGVALLATVWTGFAVVLLPPCL
jgi:fatty acid desaturase